MAKEKNSDAGENGSPRKRKLTLVIILLVTLILVIVLAAGGILFWLSKSDDHDAAQEDEAVVSKDKSSKHGAGLPPVYMNLEAFTVNLLPEQGDQYLQVILSLELEDAESTKLLDVQMPRIRNNLTITLSSKKPSELASKEGKEQLAEELRNEINMIVAPPKRKGQKPDGPVLSVLFTSFIIQ